MSENFSFQFTGVKLQVLQSEINPRLVFLKFVEPLPNSIQPLLVSVCVSVIATTILQFTPSMVDHHIS